MDRTYERELQAALELSMQEESPCTPSDRDNKPEPMNISDMVKEVEKRRDEEVEAMTPTPNDVTEVMSPINVTNDIDSPPPVLQPVITGNGHIDTVEPHLSGPHLSGLFTYPHTCLGTNPHASTESDPLIWKFSYSDSWSGN